MCQTAVPGLEVRPDMMAEAFIVNFGPQVPEFEIQEVIQHLVSGGLADRTNETPHVTRVRGPEFAIKVCFARTMEWWLHEMSLIRALEEFFSHKEEPACAVA